MQSIACLIRQAMEEKQEAKTARVPKNLSYSALLKLDHEHMEKATHAVDCQSNLNRIVYIGQTNGSGLPAQACLPCYRV